MDPEMSIVLGHTINSKMTLPVHLWCHDLVLELEMSQEEEEEWRSQLITFIITSPKMMSLNSFQQSDKSKGLVCSMIVLVAQQVKLKYDMLPIQMHRKPLKSLIMSSLMVFITQNIYIVWRAKQPQKKGQPMKIEVSQPPAHRSSRRYVCVCELLSVWWTHDMCLVVVIIVVVVMTEVALEEHQKIKQKRRQRNLIRKWIVIWMWVRIDRRKDVCSNGII